MYQQPENNSLMKMLPDSSVNDSFNPGISYTQQGGWFKSKWNDNEETLPQKKAPRRKNK